MPTYSQNNEPGLFLKTTNVFDVQSIYQLDIKSEQFKEFLVFLRRSVSEISEAVNAKDTGKHVKTEFACGQTYFPDPALTSTTPQTPVDRQVYRKTFLWPNTLPNIGQQHVAHGIDLTSNTYKMVHIEGTASQIVPHKYIPIPYVSADLTEIVQLYIDGPDIYIETNFDASAYDHTVIVIEYIKT